MLKKIGLLAAMALAALALAIPASASAAEFLMEGEPVTPGETETFSGPTAYTSALGGFGCEETEVEVEFTGGAEALITILGLNTESCTVTGVLASICGSPFSIGGEESVIEATEETDIKIPTTTTFLAFSKCGSVDFHLTNATFELDDTFTEPTHKLEELTLSGGGVATFAAIEKEVPIEVTGNLKANGEMGTYEIG